MTYNLSNSTERERFKARCNALYIKGARVELTEVSGRSTAQNSYLHLILGIFAMETGNTIEYVKTEYFKKHCSPDIFTLTSYDKILNRSIRKVRSSATISAEEMRTAIDRFKRWSAENGIYLPDPEDTERIAEMQMEIGKVRQWI